MNLESDSTRIARIEERVVSIQATLRRFEKFMEDSYAPLVHKVTSLETESAVRKDRLKWILAIVTLASASLSRGVDAVLKVMHIHI